MKSPIFLIFSLGFFPFWCIAQSEDSLKPAYKFYKTVHDFGTIPLKKQVSCVFELTNMGNDPISIIDAGTSDGGSMINSWTKEPILKGKRGKIEVLYGAFNSGIFSKSVYTKLSNGDWAYMTIKGKVTPIYFKDTIYSFWNIPLNTPVFHDFEFTNLGNEPISIIEAFDSEPYPPDYSKESITEGGRGRIKCSFNAAHIGYFTKMRTIKFSNGETFNLTITGKVTEYKFDKTVHDFGNIPQNVPVTYEFEFKNVGAKTISLAYVQNSGGHCIVNNWEKEPVLPGKTAKIGMICDPSNPGSFTKTATITFSTGDVEYLTVKGFVEAPAINPNERKD